MKKVLQILNYHTAKDIYNIYITEKNADVDEDIVYPLVLEFGKFTLGNDDPANEMILFPGNWTVKLLFDTSAETLDIVNRFSLNGGRVEIYRMVSGEETFFYAGDNLLQALEKDLVQKTIVFTFWDELGFMNKPNYSYEPFDEAAKLTGILATVLEGTDLTPIVSTEMVYIWKDALDVEHEGNLGELGAFSNYFLDATVNAGLFPTRGDVIKSILVNLASKAVITFERYLIVTPRFYDGRPVITIKKTSLGRDNHKMSFIPAYTGLRLRVWPYPPTSFTWGTVELNEDGSLKDADKVLDYKLMLGMGTGIFETYTDGDDPDYSHLVLRVVDAETYFFTKRDSCKYLKQSGVYSDADSLVKQAGNILWNIIGTPRKKIVFTLMGTEWLYDNFFQIEGEDIIYRPIKYVYDKMSEVTEVVAIDCPKGPFEPGDIEQMVFWLDAADEGTITKDSYNQISKWIDKSPNAAEWIQTETENQPRFEVNTLNSLPGVNFEYNVSYPCLLYNKTLPVDPGIIGTDDFSLWFVIKTNGNNRNLQGVFSAGRSWSGFGWDFMDPKLIAPRSSDQWGFLDAAHNYFSGRSVANGTPIILTVIRKAGIIFLFENGVLWYTSSGSNTRAWENYIWGIGAGAIKEYSVGHVYADNYEMSGHIFEGLLYKGAFSETDIAKMTAYLKKKWGIE